MSKFIYKLCDRTIKIIGAVIMALLILLLLYKKSFIAQDATEVSFITDQTILFYILLPISTAFFIFAGKLLSKIDSKILFILFSIIYIFRGCYLILNVQPGVRDDAWAVRNSAKLLNENDLSPLLPGGYLFYCSNNAGIITFMRLILAFDGSRRDVFFINLLFVILINYFIYKISEILSENNRTIINYTILFSFAFVPQLFFILFAYGTIPGFAFVVMAMYIATKIISNNIKVNKCVYLIILAVLSSIAILLKNNYMIAVIAFMIIFFIHYFKRKNIIFLLYIFILATTLVFPQKTLISHYENLRGTEIEGMPNTLYIAMGLQESSRAPGWWNGYNTNTFEATGYDADLTNKYAIENIHQSISKFISDPGYAIRFFTTKVASTWAEPTFQSLWTGALPSKGQEPLSRITSSIYNGGKLYNIIYYFCGLVYFNIILFSFITVVKSIFENNHNDIFLFPILFFIGGFLFHLIWETKSQYVYMYVICLAPLAANGIYTVINSIKNIIHKKSVQ